MAYQVFISYARGASKAEARALADKLGDLAFFDTDAIDDGEHFPQRLLDGVLEARVVVIFATKTYVERRFCRLEMRLALAGGSYEHVVVAMGEGSNAVMDALPGEIASRNWPQAGETDKLEALVRQRLGGADKPPLVNAGLIAAVFREDAQMPEPRPLPATNCSVPAGMAAASIGKRFVGRAEDLRAIHRALLDGAGGGGAAQLTSRIAAGGGFGKTRLAVEYFHRYGPAHYMGGLIWVNAATSDLESEFHRVLEAFVPGTPDLAAMRAQKRDIGGELGKALRGIGKPVLYVVDDIPEAQAGEAPRMMSSYCPALGAVTVLATSRQKSGEAGVKNVALDTLAPEAAILLLTEGVDDIAALTWSEWGKIAEWVGYLPLALDLLNRALVLGSITGPDLLGRATAAGGGTKELDALSEALKGQVPEGAVRGITEAFGISFERLDGTAKEAAKLLAQLAPGAAIPNELVKEMVVEKELPKVRTALQARHFVTGAGGQSFGVMHRLMADYLRRVSGYGGSLLLKRVCEGLEQVMDPDRCLDPLEWAQLNLCMPHAEEVFARGSVDDQCALAASGLGLRAGILGGAQGNFGRARRFEEQVLKICRKLLGEEHPDTLTSMNNLAGTLRDQGDLVGARALQERVLEIQRRVLGEEHPDRLRSMNNLAGTLRDQGDLVGARALQERVLEVRRRVLGEEHPDTLASMNNLAATLWGQGDLVGARDLQERVLEIWRRVLGEEHPDTLRSMNNLAETLVDEGDLVGARDLQERVLEVRRRVLGEEHPDTLTSMNNLAATLRGQGDLVGARDLQERVLEVRRRVLGEEHPDTLTSMNNLAETLRGQGDLVGARDLQERVLEISWCVLGEEHPVTLLSMNNLAVTLYYQGELASSRELLRKCLEGRRKVLGENHPDTLNTAGSLQAIDDADSAGAG